MAQNTKLELTHSLTSQTKALPSFWPWLFTHQHERNWVRVWRTCQLSPDIMNLLMTLRQRSSTF